jgi:glycerophosphoryl diester phosphodiesterase
MLFLPRAERARPLVIADRGASGYLPEHTLASYMLALLMGADAIKTDVVPTRDDQLVARSEPRISQSTNVARLFVGRWRGPDGPTGEHDWFAHDATLEELRMVLAREPRPKLRPWVARHDDRYPIPALQDVIDLRRASAEMLGREIGLVIEIRHPTYFASIGRPIESRLFDVLERNDLNRRDANVVVSSYEVEPLRVLSLALEVPIIQQLHTAELAPADLERAGDPRTYRDLASDEGLREIARYAAGVAAHKRHIREDAEAAPQPSDFVARARANNLLVLAVGFANEDRARHDLRRPGDPDGHAGAAAEYARFLDVDGVYSDHPDIALKAFGDEPTVLSPLFR